MKGAHPRPPRDRTTIGQWPLPSRRTTRSTSKYCLFISANFTGTYDHARPRSPVQASAGEPALPPRIGRWRHVTPTSIKPEHRTPCRHQSCETFPRSTRPESRRGFRNASRTVARYGGHRHEQLAEQWRPPDPGEQMPPVTRHDPDVDQGHAGKALRMPGCPRQPPRSAEVMQHQVHPLDGQGIQQRIEVGPITVDGVVEVLRLVGLTESLACPSRWPENGATRCISLVQSPVSPGFPWTKTTASADSTSPACVIGVRTPASDRTVLFNTTISGRAPCRPEMLQPTG